MNLLTNLKASKAILLLTSPDAAQSSEARQALQTLRKIGPSVIPKLIKALDTPHDTDAISKLLITMLNSASLPIFIDELSNESARVVKGVVEVLKASTEYDPNRLLEYFEDPDISKNALGEILLARHSRVDAKRIMSLLDKVSSNTRPVLYKVLDKTITISLLPAIVAKTDCPEPMVRVYLISLLARFKTPESTNTLVRMLGDTNKQVRQSALKALAQINSVQHTAAICALLKDPDLTVQASAIETLATIDAPDTIKYLIEVLQDDSEYIRRAAVEVLNEVGNQSAIKDLLSALRDADWWVKVRAADALGTIGGPRVFEAVLQLIKDEDEFLRRTAVEILNTSKDPRAFDRLVEALDDEDWWVRERAADALASIGDKRAVSPLIKMLERHTDGHQVAIRALQVLGDNRAIHPLLRQLESNDIKIRKEALSALMVLTDQEHAPTVENAVTLLMDTNNPEMRNMAQQAVKNLHQRFGKAYHTADAADIDFSASDDAEVMVETPPTLTIGTHIIDAALLRPGDVFAERYQVIEQIGKGAFGVVVLVEDTFVNDRFILKFLNPHVSIDEQMIKRFTHELRYARKVTHENVIRIYDFITYGRTYAISMEYFPSHSLNDELVDEKPIDLDRGLHIVKAICRGMSTAQNVGVVHRDLKPSNILINDQSQIKTVDFGLAAAASALDSRLTRTGILVGTPTYMAPEQVRGKQIDSRTDIYSTGIIMYEMFTGKAPYTGEETMAIMFQHVEGLAKPPCEVNPDIPKPLEAIIQKAMAIEKEDRYQHFDALIADLDSISESRSKE